MRWPHVLAILAALVIGCGSSDKSTKTAAGKGKGRPTAKVPPDDVWSSMRELEKDRKSVDTALTDWDADSMARSALRVSSEIKAFPEKYESLPSEFLSLADAVRVKAEEAATEVKAGDFTKARSSWGDVLQACQQCHQVWSGPTTGYELPAETPRPAASEPAPDPAPAAAKPTGKTTKGKKK
jgi:hypothetical protein